LAAAPAPPSLLIAKGIPSVNISPSATEAWFL
jgi:hypothetical protein